MLLSGDAHTWFMHNAYDVTTLTYTALAKDLREYFCPADHAWRAREQLAQCRQKNVYDVTSYTTRFKQCVQRVPSKMDDADLMDRFIRGLHPAIARDVLLSMPQTFEEAGAVAERVAAVWRFTNPRHRGQGRYNNGRYDGDRGRQ